MSTAPWDAHWPATLATVPHFEHVTATASGGTLPAPVELDVTRLSVKMDESWTPHVQVNLTVVTPPDVALLDPRADVRLTIDVGYSTPDLPPDVHRLANVALRTRRTNLLDGTTDLTASSDESLVHDGVVGQAEDAAFDRSGINEFVQSVITEALGGAPTLSSTYAAGYLPNLVANPMTYYASPMPRLTSLLDPIEGQLFCGPDRVWRMRPRPNVAATPVVTLRAGVGGTVEVANTLTSREDDAGWANSVVVRYDGDINGVARVTDGPYSSTGSRQNTLVVRRDWTVTKAEADAAAAAVLRRAFTRGRTLSLSAVALPWLRPGDTIGYAPTATASADLVIASAVTFTWPGSLMSLELRHPETGTITIGG